MHFADHVRIRLISKLISDISRTLQKLRKYLMATLFQQLSRHPRLFSLLFFLNKPVNSIITGKISNNTCYLKMLPLSYLLTLLHQSL